MGIQCGDSLSGLCAIIVAVVLFSIRSQFGSSSCSASIIADDGHKLIHSLPPHVNIAMSEKNHGPLSPRRAVIAGELHVFLRTRNERGAECRVCGRRWYPPWTESVEATSLHRCRLPRGLCGKCQDRLTGEKLSEDQLKTLLRVTITSI